MVISDQKIKEIEGFLKMGMLCYIHKKTKEFVFLMDVDDDEFYSTTGERQKGYDEVNNNEDDYYKLTSMSSKSAFKIMEAFADSVNDYSIKGKLFQALGQRSPFRRFRDVLNYNEMFLKEWYEFEATANLDYIKSSLENIEKEDELD